MNLTIGQIVDCVQPKRQFLEVIIFRKTMFERLKSQLNQTCDKDEVSHLCSVPIEVVEEGQHDGEVSKQLLLGKVVGFIRDDEFHIKSFRKL